jgi:hypothetical protein
MATKKNESANNYVQQKTLIKISLSSENDKSEKVTRATMKRRFRKSVGKKRNKQPQSIL